MKILGIITAAILATICAAILEGWSISILWKWFIVGQFGLPALRIPIAIGISLIWTILSNRYSEKKNNDENYYKKLLKILGDAAWVCAYSVAVGYVAKFWI